MYKVKKDFKDARTGKEFKIGDSIEVNPEYEHIYGDFIEIAEPKSQKETAMIENPGETAIMGKPKNRGKK